ncbi:hypothetical protein JCM10450v2_007783 [Rhodotorula kratochvilovae]
MASTGTAAPRQTDFRRRTVLPSTHHNLRTGTNTHGDALDLPSDEYLDRIEEELNRRVDADAQSLVDGMRDLVALARLKTEQMLRSAQSLLALAHTLKLLHLFGDGQAGEHARETRAGELTREIAALKQRVRELAGEGAAPEDGTLSA